MYIFFFEIFVDDIIIEKRRTIEILHKKNKGSHDKNQFFMNKVQFCVAPQNDSHLLLKRDCREI